MPPDAPLEPVVEPASGGVRRGLLVGLWIGGRVLVGLLLTLVFVSALMVGALVHVNLPVSRRLVGNVLTTSLTAFFQGSLTVGQVEHLGLRRVAVSEVVVRDPEEEVVLRVVDLRAHADLLAIGRQLLFGEGKQSLVVDHVRAERVECHLVPEADSSTPTIARAFTPVVRSPRDPALQRSRRQIRVWLGNVEIGRAWGRGHFPDLATLELDLAKVQGTVLATEKGAAVDVRRFGAVVRGLGGADARGTGELHVRAPGAVWSNFDGFVGDVAVSAFARFKRNQVELRLDLPRASPAAARSVWKEWPLHDDVTLHAEAKGELPLLQTTATLEVGPATVKTEARVRLAGDVGVRADIDAQHVDLRSLVPSAPPTNISAKTRVVVFRGTDQLVVKVNGYSLPATVADLDVPATDVTGDFEDGGFVGTATLHEKGVPLKATLKVGPDGAIDLDVDARTFRMQKAPRLAAWTRADGVAQARVRGRLQDRQLVADVDATIDRFALDTIRLDHLRVVGKVSGAIDAPSRLRVDGRMSGAGADLGRFSFQTVDVRATGPVLAPRVVARLLDEEGPSFELAGVIEHQERRAHDLVLAVSRSGARVEGKLAHLDLSGGEVRVEGLALAGVGGKLGGNVIVRPELIEADVVGERIDLAALGRILGLDDGVLAGRLGVDAEVTAAADFQRGRVALRLDDGAFLGISGVDVGVTAQLEGAHLTGAGDFGVAKMGRFDAEWDTHLGAHPLEVRAWRDLVGRVSVRFVELDLAELAWLVPPDWNIEQLRGKARATLELNRRLTAALPSVNISAVAQNLEVTRRSAEGADGAVQLQTYDGLDVQAGLSLNGETGFTLTNATLYHGLDPLIVSESRFNLDLRRFVEHPEQLTAMLAESPAAIDVELRARRLEEWPTWIRPTAIAGSVGGQLHLIGSLADPLVNVGVKARGLRWTGSEYGRPIDVQAALNYRVVEGAFSGNADFRHDGRRIAHGQIDGTAPEGSILASRQPETPRWQGAAQLLFLDMPLEVIPALHEAQMGGALKGALTLERGPEHPTVRGSLEIKRVSVARARLGEGTWRFESTQDAVETRIQLRKDGGWIRSQLAAGLAWDQGWPEVDPAQPVAARLEASQFEAAVLAPFVTKVLNELTGKIDAQLTAELWAESRPPDAEEDRGSVVWHPRVSGTAAMRGGVVQLAGLGMDLREIDFDAAVSEVGRETKLEIVNLSARGRDTTSNVQGRADLYFHGVELQRGVATLSATDLAIPVGGISLARVTTARDERTLRRGVHEPVTVRIERHPEMMLAEVEIPTLMARLPPSVTRTVIDTSDNPNIQVAQPLRKPEAPRRGNAFPWKIAFDLGPRARVFYDEFEVQVSGRPEITLGSQTTLDGDIHLEPGGRLPVLGKEFKIESGHIWLDPEQPANPMLDITATWESPYAMIYLRIQGRWYDPDLQLESDGEHSPDQIWIILAGGSPDDPTGSQEGGGVQAAYRAARTLGVMRLFETDRIDFTPDTSEGNTKARVSYRVSDRIRVEAIGGSETDAAAASTEDSATDASNQDRRFVGAGAIEYRIDKNWSVRTEAGNASAEVDLLWQYRY